MLQRANSPYAKAFFNYLSIVEICIDKGLSGGDLCSCQLSQRSAPPSETNWIDRHAKPNRGAFLGAWDDSPGACGPKKGLAGWGRLLHPGESMELVGLWPGGERGGAGGGSVARLKPLRVPASRCETWHRLWHTQGLEWHRPGCKHAEYTHRISYTHTPAQSRTSIRGSTRILKLREINYNLIIYHFPSILSWSLEQPIDEGVRLLIGQQWYRLKWWAAVGAPRVKGHGLDLGLGGVSKQTWVIVEDQAATVWMKIMGPLPPEFHPNSGGMHQQRWRRLNQDSHFTHSFNSKW